MAGPKTAPLAPKIADRLLDLLGDSDKFRELFQGNPQAALELIGFDIAPDLKETLESTRPSITSCLSIQQLASKEVIREARNELRTMLLSGLGQVSPLLEATKSE